MSVNECDVVVEFKRKYVFNANQVFKIRFVTALVLAVHIQVLRSVGKLIVHIDFPKQKNANKYGKNNRVFFHSDRYMGWEMVFF